MWRRAAAAAAAPLLPAAPAGGRRPALPCPALSAPAAVCAADCSAPHCPPLPSVCRVLVRTALPAVCLHPLLIFNFPSLSFGRHFLLLLIAFGTASLRYPPACVALCPTGTHPCHTMDRLFVRSVDHTLVGTPPVALGRRERAACGPGPALRKSAAARLPPRAPVCARSDVMSAAGAQGERRRQREPTTGGAAAAGRRMQA